MFSDTIKLQHINSTSEDITKDIYDVIASIMIDIDDVVEVHEPTLLKLQQDLIIFYENSVYSRRGGGRRPSQLTKTEKQAQYRKNRSSVKKNSDNEKQKVERQIRKRKHDANPALKYDYNQRKSTDLARSRELTRRRNAQTLLETYNDVKEKWPEPITDGIKNKKYHEYIKQFKQDAVEEQVCGVCAENVIKKELITSHLIPNDDLLKPNLDYVVHDPVRLAMERDMEHENHPHLKGLLLEEAGINEDGEVNMCQSCHSSLNNCKIATVISC
eukprot:Lithocolla_globosa_v1_NODE_391_length_4199_cov_7.277027.p2 type:complete len:272 gc:universal NODE_391_length_4199_cov_7.277027:3601-2786(-)